MTEKKERVGLAVHVLIDRSGSMCGEEIITTQAYNEYIDQLKMAVQATSVSLSFFSSTFRNKYADVLSYDVPELKTRDWHVGGGTCTPDAIWAALDMLEAVNAEQRVLVVLTDGSGASYAVSYEKAKGRVKKMVASGGAAIMLGANQDASYEGGRLGFPPEMCLTFGMRNVKRAMEAAALATLKFANTGDIKASGFETKVIA